MERLLKLFNKVWLQLFLMNVKTNYFIRLTINNRQLINYTVGLSIIYLYQIINTINVKTCLKNVILTYFINYHKVLISIWN